MGRYQASNMNTIYTCILVGLVCGIISAFGIGGGSLLMIWLTAILSMEQRTAQGINLLYFLPTAVAALLVHNKNHMVKWKVALPAIACGCITAALFSWVGNHLELNLLRKLFGGFLVVVGFCEIRKKPKKQSDSSPSTER